MADPISDLIAEGYEARRQRRFPDALSAFNQAVELSRDTSNQSLLAKAFTGLGQIERDLNNNQPSLRHYTNAVEIYRDRNDVLRLAHTLRHVGDILRHEGRLAEAGQNYIEALDIYRKHDGTPPLDLANTLRGFALLKTDLNEVAASERLWQEARMLYQSLGIQAGMDESDTQLHMLHSK